MARRKKIRVCDDEDVALVPPTMTVHEAETGLKAPIGFVHFPDPPAEPVKPKRRRKPVAKKKAAKRAR